MLSSTAIEEVSHHEAKNDDAQLQSVVSSARPSQDSDDAAAAGIPPAAKSIPRTTDNEADEVAPEELEHYIQTFNKTIKSCASASILRGVVPRRVVPSDFKAVRLLGKGDVGRVYMVVKKDTEHVYAMKVLRKKDVLARNKIHRVLTEWEVLAKSDHPFICRMYWSFQSKTKLYFINEYCAGGEFFHFLKRQPGQRLPEKNTKFYAAEVLVALEYLHINGVLYRDIKPENILIHQSGHLRLTDFDLSKVNRSFRPTVIRIGDTPDVGSAPNQKDMYSSFVGTVEYLAPEIIKDSGHTSLVDWWGFGILIFEMLYGYTPFKGSSQSDTFRNITKQTVKFPPEPKVSPAAKSIITKLLQPNPEQRLGAKIGAAEVRAHKWFSDMSWGLVRNMEPPHIPTLRHALDDGNFRTYRSADLVGDEPISDTEEPASPPVVTKPVAGSSVYNHPAHLQTTFEESNPFHCFEYYASPLKPQTYGDEFTLQEFENFPGRSRSLQDFSSKTMPDFSSLSSVQFQPQNESNPPPKRKILSWLNLANTPPRSPRSVPSKSASSSPKKSESMYARTPPGRSRTALFNYLFKPSQRRQSSEQTVTSPTRRHMLAPIVPTEGTIPTVQAQPPPGPQAEQAPEPAAPGQPDTEAKD